jgi:hypothetical protein
VAEQKTRASVLTGAEVGKAYEELRNGGLSQLVKGPRVPDSCIGADPGPTTGLCLLDYEGGRLTGRMLLQCDAASAPLVLRELLIARQNMPAGKRAGSVEKFVTGASAGSRGKAADATRELVMELAEVLQLFGYRVSIRPAADVKPWAGNKRVAAALGIKEAQMTDSLRHAWDAARHCVYGARDAGIIADPLLRRQPEALHDR